MAERYLHIEGYGNFPVTEHEAERLEAGKSITINIFKTDTTVSPELKGLYTGMNPAVDPEKLAEQMNKVIGHEPKYNYPPTPADWGESVAEYARRRYGSEDAQSKYNYPRSVHRQGETITDPHWKKPTLDERLTPNTGYDPVDRPAHYTEDREIEPIDVIDDWTLGFYEGQVLKYISRAGRKTYSELEDLRKAKFYLDRLVELVKKEEGEE